MFAQFLKRAVCTTAVPLFHFIRVFSRSPFFSLSLQCSDGFMNNLLVLMNAFRFSFSKFSCLCSESNFFMSSYQVSNGTNVAAIDSFLFFSFESWVFELLFVCYLYAIMLIGL